jgi:Na+/phosphate symporter
MDFRNLPPLAWLGLALIACGALIFTFSVLTGIGFAVVGIILIRLSYAQRKRT